MSRNIKRTNYYKDGMLRINVLDFGAGEQIVWNHFDEEGNKIESTDEVCISIADDCDYQIETLIMDDDTAPEEDGEPDELDMLMDYFELELKYS